MQIIKYGSLDHPMIKENWLMWSRQSMNFWHSLISRVVTTKLHRCMKIKMEQFRLVFLFHKRNFSNKTSPVDHYYFSAFDRSSSLIINSSLNNFTSFFSKEICRFYTFYPFFLTFCSPPTHTYYFYSASDNFCLCEY